MRHNRTKKIAVPLFDCTCLSSRCWRGGAAWSTCDTSPPWPWASPPDCRRRSVGAGRPPWPAVLTTRRWGSSPGRRPRRLDRRKAGRALCPSALLGWSRGEFRPWPPAPCRSCSSSLSPLLPFPVQTKSKVNTVVRTSVVDPDSTGSGSAFIWLSWIRIRIGNADPDPGEWKLTKLYK